MRRFPHIYIYSLFFLFPATACFGSAVPVVQVNTLTLHAVVDFAASTFCSNPDNWCTCHMLGLRIMVTNARLHPVQSMDTASRCCMLQSFCFINESFWWALLGEARLQEHCCIAVHLQSRVKSFTSSMVAGHLSLSKAHEGQVCAGASAGAYAMSDLQRASQWTLSMQRAPCVVDMDL
jgi:hypothetical protein